MERGYKKDHCIQITEESADWTYVIAQQPFCLQMDDDNDNDSTITQTWFYEDNKKVEIGKIGSIEYTIKKES